MSQSKTGTLPLPIQTRTRETAEARPQSVSARRAPSVSESAFLDIRLIARSLMLGAVLAAVVALIGWLLPIADCHIADGVRPIAVSAAPRLLEKNAVSQP